MRRLHMLALFILAGALTFGINAWAQTTTTTADPGDRKDARNDTKDIHNDKKDIHKDEQDIDKDKKDARKDEQDIDKDKKPTVDQVANIQLAKEAVEAAGGPVTIGNCKD